MILKQYYLGCLAQASYLLGDERTKTAVVVDPRRDVDEYLADAEELGLAIRHVVLTHFHADFAAGHLELAARTGATIHLGARAEAEYDFEPLRDGDVHDSGDLRIEVRETPGHTPESICLVVYDLARDRERPQAVLTGDTLFLGDVGRPDLMASVGVTAEELGGWLYDSLHEKLLTLPDETLVYPGHGAGSMCGKSLSSETVSTLGAQRASNYALQPMTREEFVRLVAADQPAAPRYFAYDAALNRERHPTLDETVRAARRPLALEELLRRANAGVQVLDVRDAETFAAGHLVGSLNVGLDGKFAMWVGAVLDPRVPIVLVAPPGREEEAIVRLGRIGFDRVEGYLQGGFDAARGRDDLVRRMERVDAAELARRLEAPDAPLLLDVRGPGEWAGGHVEGAVHIPLPELVARAGELPRGRPIAIQCGSGYRSVLAASWLADAGHGPLLDQRGGFAAWRAAGLPEVQPAPATAQ